MTERKKIGQLVQERIESGDVFFSFEYFPPRTPQGVINLYSKLDRMAQLEPLFIDVTWGAGGSTSTLTTAICINAQKYCGIETNMHLTCTNMPIDTLNEAVRRCKEAGLKNLLTLRGDPPKGQEWKQIEGGFGHAADLVKYVRKNYADYFGIGVAGYPEKHLDCFTYEADLQHLKEKVDAGADFIITQLFFDAHYFLKFYKDCRSIGITVPIVPGIMPIMNAVAIQRICTLCGSKLAPEIKEALEAIKADPKAVKEFGIKQCTEMCRKLLENGVKGLHFYTLNQEKSTVSILKNLGLLDNIHLHKSLPWRRPVLDNRLSETVRPVHWINRPKSYIARTENWSQFPNRYWGGFASKFETLIRDGTQSLHPLTKDVKKRAWGETPSSSADVQAVFVNFAKGNINTSPWREISRNPNARTEDKKYIELNEQGFWVINYLPKLNGVSSTHPSYGWGGPGGHIYQRGYLELFTSPENWAKLHDVLKKYPTLKYQAGTAQGKNVGNIDSVIGITWAVWPEKELLQPNIVDPICFNIWKEEAFLLWEDWYTTYPEDSASYKLIRDISNTYYLVYIVDTDFIGGDILQPFRDDQLKQKISS